MKILVFSDTHGNISNMIDLIKLHQSIDYIIHLGDHSSDAEEIKRIFPELVIKCVKGNCDFDDVYGVDELIMEVEGKKIFMTHGHRYGVKYGYEKICEKAKSLEVDIVLFGHTHIPFLDYYGDIRVMNPGSISGIRSAEGPTFGIIEINSDNKIHMTLSRVSL